MSRIDGPRKDDPDVALMRVLAHLYNVVSWSSRLKAELDRARDPGDFPDLDAIVALRTAILINARSLATFLCGGKEDELTARELALWTPSNPLKTRLDGYIRYANHQIAHLLHFDPNKHRGDTPLELDIAPDLLDGFEAFAVVLRENHDARSDDVAGMVSFSRIRLSTPYPWPLAGQWHAPTTNGPRMTCTPTDHHEWTQLRDDHGRPFALACSRCMATAPVPEAEPGVRLVALPPGFGRKVLGRGQAAGG